MLDVPQHTLRRVIAKICEQRAAACASGQSMTRADLVLHAHDVVLRDDLLEHDRLVTVWYVHHDRLADLLDEPAHGDPARDAHLRLNVVGETHQKRSGHVATVLAGDESALVKCSQKPMHHGPVESERPGELRWAKRAPLSYLDQNRQSLIGRL